MKSLNKFSIGYIGRDLLVMSWVDFNYIVIDEKELVC